MEEIHQKQPILRMGVMTKRSNNTLLHNKTNYKIGHIKMYIL